LQNGEWNHQLKDAVPKFYSNKLLDCMMIRAKQFPYHQSNDLTTNGNHSQQLIPFEIPLLNISIKASMSQRAECYYQPSDIGQNLSMDAAFTRSKDLMTLKLTSNTISPQHNV
jgi:hypothetical protein